MNTGIPDEWMSDSLLLLVGGNPLPNYVAAKLLLKPGGTLHLLCTVATGGIADAIAATVGGSAKRHEISNPASRSSVAEIVGNIVKRDCQNQTVGLNYTGGTKSMAVHAHAEVHQRRQDAILTYLDSRALQLYSDADIGPVSVQFSVEPTIVDLVRLHGLRLVDEERFVKDGRSVLPKPSLPQLDTALARAHSTEVSARAYSEWCSAYLRHGERKKLVEKLRQFPQNPVPLPTAPALAEVTQQMQVAFNSQTGTFDPQAVVDQNIPSITSVEKLVEYLDGGWMELYVAEAFMQNRTKHRLHSISISLDIDNKQSPFDFEFDVAALQGYQLYAVSCTRSYEKGLCKSKLFEALTRAEQLGGSEAKTALVCAYQHPKELEKEVQERWRPETGSRIRVFGAQDLADLQSEFAVWLRQA